MPRKQVTEMNTLERLHYSIGGKTFRGILLFTLIISLSAAGFGSYLYMASVRREFRSRTWQMSRTGAYMLDTEKTMEMAEKVIGIYEGMSEEDRLCLHDKDSELLSRFDPVRDEYFEETRQTLDEIRESHEGRAAFTAFIDPDTGRRVFIADSDPTDGFCPPGSWDVYDEDLIKSLLEGRSYDIDSFYGFGAIPSAIFRMEPYGYRCTAATIIGMVDRYPVLVMFDTDMNLAARASWRFLWQHVIFLILITALSILLSIRHTRKNVTGPLNELAGAAESYIHDRTDGSRGGQYFSRLDIRTGDEIEYLASTMKAMEQDLGTYVRNLTRITAEKERISTELSLATDIQAAMLPHIYPPFPDRKEIDLFASMYPAREVGGDFYDYYLVDDDHLCICIADVSGKGIPAALFMMVSKIILQSCAMLGRSPGEILTKTNEAICSNNEAGMFVTVWIGILELSTGRLTASSAGHEYPVIRRPGGKFELFKDRHGLVIGAMEGITYKEYELVMEPGSKIFIYTDGVPEAADEDNRMFGNERMLQALNTDPAAPPRQVLGNVKKAVDEFVSDAEQFDDLTMLCLEYRGSAQ